jgi:hypothetical protein
MKKFTSIAIAFLLALSVVPAMAADQAGSNMEPVTSQVVDIAPSTFQAFSNLPATEREALTPLTDKELTAIEGSFFDDVCIVCLNIAIIEQTNVNAGNATGVGVGGVHGDGIGVGAIDQSNSARVRQSIN